MPQEHYVLRCFSCETFQAHIVKKAKKWECKMCGEKQSVKRNYGKGSGKDCRNQVMKLNELRLRNDCSSVEADNNALDDGFTFSELNEDSNKPDPNKPLSSKWKKYLDEPVNDAEGEAEDCVTQMYNLSDEKKKKRTKRIPDDYSGKNKKICRKSDPIEVSSSIKAELFSPPNIKQIENCKINEKVSEMNSFIKSNNTLKPSKYTEYLDDDDGDDTKESDNENIGTGKENKINKLPSVSEKVSEMNTFMKSNLKPSKFTKYLDDDDDDDNTKESDNENIETGKENNTNKLPSVSEKVSEMNTFMKSNLKPSKFTKYLDDDDDDDDNTKESDNENIETGKENNINKLPNIFDSDPNDLDSILSLE